MTDTTDVWYREFSQNDLAAIRAAIPESIRAGHERSSRAQTEYADPDGDQDVYGAGMARAVQKELAKRLASLDSYREQFIAGSRRKMIYVGDALLFPHRVGKSMPRNHLRIRLNYLPEHRRHLLTKTSNVKYLDEGLFDLPLDITSEVPSLAEVLEVMKGASPKVTLFVPYYSSTAGGIGSVYWGPARLNGKHLEITAAERITLERLPVNMTVPASSIAPAVLGFAGKERKRTPVRLRQKRAETMVDKS